MSEHEIPEPPEPLGEAGMRLWREIMDEYELAADEQRVLASACALSDTIAELTEAMKGQPKTVQGSARQLVVHPLITEIRQSRQTQASLLRQLGLRALEDSDGEVSVTENARRAALARWNRGR